MPRTKLPRDAHAMLTLLQRELVCVEEELMGLLEGMYKADFLALGVVHAIDVRIEAIKVQLEDEAKRE